MPSMEPQEHWDVVRECDLFRDFGDSELQRLVPIARERHIAAGAPIIEAGEHAEALYVIADGLIRIPSLVGTPASLMLSRPEAVGVAALVPPHRHVKTAVASTDCRLLEFPIHPLRYLVENDPSLSSRLMSRVAEYLHQRLVEVVADAHGRPIGNYIR